MIAVGHPGCGWKFTGGSTNNSDMKCCHNHVVNQLTNIPDTPNIPTEPLAADLPDLVVKGSFVQYDYADGFVRYDHDGTAWVAFVNPDSLLPFIHI